MEREQTRGNGNSGYEIMGVTGVDNDLPHQPQPIDRLMPGMAGSLRRGGR